MAVLCVVSDDGERRIDFSLGPTVALILDDASMRMRSSCGGIGACGLCLIRVMEGKMNDPSENELARLSPEQIDAGIRLACQSRPLGDIRIIIENPAQHIKWRELAADECPLLRPPAYAGLIESMPEAPLGVAVDLGTTQIRVAVIDMADGHMVAGRIGMNPQAVFGSDVLARLTAAAGSKALADEISGLARQAIGEAMRDIEAGSSVERSRIVSVVIVGNTAMLTLLARKNYALLLDPANWMGRIDSSLEDACHFRAALGIGEIAQIDVVQPLSGFVGSDLLAGVIATGLTEGEAGSVLIDFGTNSEIALWDGKMLWVTSASGGPAFEGSGLICGMPAEPGAVYRVSQPGHSGMFQCEVLGGDEPKGICGSGLIDAVACMLRAGMLNSAGSFTSKAAIEQVVLCRGRRDIVLKKRDIDLFQRAKAAIAAGIICLAGRSGLRLKDIRRVCIGGAFGRHLNAQSAIDVGLIPNVLSNTVELCGNTALTGCGLLLLDPDSHNTLESLKKKAVMLNMTQAPEFEELFIENLYLRPMRME